LKSRLILVAVFVLVVLLASGSLYFWLSAAQRNPLAGCTIRRISRSQLRGLLAWDVPVKDRLENSVGYQPSATGRLVLYRTGEYGQEVYLFDTLSQTSRPVYSLSLTDPGLASDYRVEAFWLGTYEGIIVTEAGGDFGPYRVFHYDLVTDSLRELAAALFVHPEQNLNTEGVLGSPPGSTFLVVERAEDSCSDGLYLVALSGEIQAHIYSGPRGTFRYVGCSDQVVAYTVAEAAPPDDAIGVRVSLHLYGLSSQTTSLVPTSGSVMTPTLRPGLASITFLDKITDSSSLRLKEYRIPGTGETSTLLELREGETYCWSVDGRILFVVDEHN
jgi:hypothetical protein